MPAARRLDVRALHDRRLAGELRRHRTSRNNVRTSSSDIASTSSPRSCATAANRSYRSPKPRIVRRSALSPSTPSLRATATTENRTSPISSSAFVGVVRLDRGRQLVDLLPERGERALRRTPLEPPAGRPPLHLRRARERRQRRGDVVLDRLLSAGLLGLEPLPVHEHLVGAAHLDLAEHVRVPMDQLLDQPLRHVVHVPPAVVGRDLRVERDLEQQIAELVADRVGVIGVDRLEQLVRLLEQVARERLVRLLRVPRAAARRTQPRLHADQVEETRSALAGRDGTFGNVGEALAHAEGPAGADGVAVSVDVLEMRMTWSVSSSKRPYFGLTSTAPPETCSTSQSLKTVAALASSSCCFTSSNDCTSFFTMRITCQPNCGLDGLRDLAGLQRDRGRPELRHVRGGHGRTQAAGVLLGGRVDGDLLREVQEVLLGGAGARDLRVDVVGLGLRLHEDVVHLHGRVAREVVLVLLAEIGLRRGVGGDGRLHRAEQQDPVRQVRQVGARQVVGLQLVVDRLLPEAVVQLRDRVRDLGVGHLDVVVLRVDRHEMLLDQVREREPRAGRLFGLVAVHGPARLLVEAREEAEDILLMRELRIRHVDAAQRRGGSRGAAARGEQRQAERERDGRDGTGSGTGSHEQRV